jgi:hypothetical protein
LLAADTTLRNGPDKKVSKSCIPGIPVRSVRASETQGGLFSPHKKIWMLLLQRKKSEHLELLKVTLLNTNSPGKWNYFFQ